MSDLRVLLEPSLVEILPGQSIAVAVHVTNASDIVDEYEISLVGKHPGITAASARVSLLRDERKTATLTIESGSGQYAPPAGGRVIGILVASLSNPLHTRVEELQMTVAAMTESSITVDPQLVRGGSSARLTVAIANHGNTGFNVGLRGHDPEQIVGYTFSPQLLSVPAGAQANATLIVRAPQPLTGTDQRRMLTIHADGSPTPLSATATFVQQPRISATTTRILGAVAALLVLAGAILGASLLASRGNDNVQVDAGDGTTGADDQSTTPETEAPKPDPIAVPNAAGLSLTDALALIAQTGLAPGSVTKAESDSIPEGHVIATEPPAGTPLDPGTEVGVLVSTGPTPPAPATVPDLSGLDEATATDRLAEACAPSPCLTPSFSRDFSDSVEEDLVLRQVPPPNATVDSGSTIQVVLSLGPEETEQSQSPATAFVGEWINQDLNTGGNTRFEIGELEGSIAVRAFGKCSPTDCDWGVEVGTVSGSSASLTWDPGFVERSMVMTLLDDGRLQVSTDHFYKDSRPNRSDVAVFIRNPSE